jgi:hypothetical protein
VAHACNPLHPIAAEYTFSPRTHGTFSRTDQRLGHKTGSINFKGLKSHEMFSIHNGMKLGISNREKSGKFTEMWK